MSGFNTTIQTGFARSRSEALFPRLFPDAGWWCPSLQSPGGTRLHDLRGGNWGTLTNMDPATDWVVNGGKGALDFDGSNDYVATASPFFGGSMGVLSSMSCWLKTTLTTIQSAWGVVETGVAGAAILYVNSQNGSASASGSVTIQIRDNAGGIDLAYATSTDVNDGNWHHLLVSRNLGVTRLFIDGKNTPLIFINNTLGSSSITFARPLSIGARNLRGVIDQFFTGQLDDIRNFRTSLTADDVRQLWQLGRGNMPIARRRRYTEQAAAGFKAYWARRQSQLIGGGV